MNPEQLNQHMQRAVQAHQQGDLPVAEAAYRQALAAFPQQADILNLLGTLCAQAGRLEEGLGFLQRAWQLQPGHPHIGVNLGETQQRAGMPEAARQTLARVVQQHPQLAAAHFNLANVLKQLQELDQALVHYQQAVALKPQQADYLYNYGNTLQQMGRYRSAQQAFEQTLALAPHKAEAHNNLGTVLLEWEQFDAALSHYQRAVALKPDFAEAYNNLQQWYESNGEPEAARATLRELQRLRPETGHLALKKATLLPVILPQREAIDTAFQELEEAIAQTSTGDLELAAVFKDNLSYPSISTYYGKNDLALRKAYAALFAPLFAEAVSPPRPVWRPEDPVRLGFVVTRGHEGVFLKCMKGLIEQVSAFFEVCVICVAPNGAQIIGAAMPGTPCVEIPADFPAAAAALRAVACDILYYWEVGTDTLNYLLPFTRPAPYQVACWGWPVTSGLPCMDYFLSADSLEPPEGEQHYSEKLLRLERLPVFYSRPPVPDTPPERMSYGLDEKQHLYLCAQNLRKIHPDMDALFGAILEADPQATLLLIEDKRPRLNALLRARFQRSLPQHWRRIQWLPRMDEQRYLGLLQQVDVLLDSLHYTGGANTNYDAFAAGTPVITWPSHLHRGRYTAAAYQQMGYTELIAASAEDYVALAVGLASDPQRRAEASRRVLAGCDELLEDRQAVGAFVRSVEAILQQRV
ncbi:MAG: tetratricopeptide repeat protein [Candidatus Sericytochromatia bacterium]